MFYVHEEQAPGTNTGGKKKKGGDPIKEPNQAAIVLL
jgi:hypothetical protein